MSPEAPPPLQTRQPKKERDPLLTKPRQNAFLAAYSECAIIRRAARAAKIDRCTHYYWMENDPEYVERFNDAQEAAFDILEQEALRRATKGVARPLMFGGEQVMLDDPDNEGQKIPGVIREYSDTLLIFLMKGARPEKYRDRFEVTGNINHNVKVHEIREHLHRISIDADGLSALELIARRQLENKTEGAAPAGPVALLEGQPASGSAQGAQDNAPAPEG